METIDQIDDFHDQLAREYDEFRKKHPAFQAWNLALPNCVNAAGINPAGAPGAPGLASVDVEAAKVNEDEEVSLTKTKFGAAFCNWFAAVTFIFSMTILIYAGYLWPPIFAIMFSVILTCYLFERFYACMRKDRRGRKKIDMFG